MQKIAPTPLSALQICLIIIVSNTIPLAFISTKQDFIFLGSFDVFSINEYIKFAVYLIGINLIIGFTLLSWARKRCLKIPYNKLLYPCMILYFSFVLSLCNATDTSRAFVMGVEIYILPVLMFILLSTQRITEKQYTILLLAICLAPLATAIIGIAQALQWSEWTKKLPVVIPGPNSGSLFYHHNLAGEYIVLFITPLVGIILCMKKKLYQISLFSIVFVLIAYLVLTTARGAWVALIAAVVLAFLFAAGSSFYVKKNSLIVRNQKSFTLYPRLLIFIAIIPLFIFLIYTSPTWAFSSAERASMITKEFENIDLSHTSGRLEIWHDSLNMLWEHPWIGFGSDQYKLDFPRFIEKFQSIQWNLQAGIFVYPHRTHNDFLQIWIELGVIGFIALVYLFSLISWRAWKGLCWMLQEQQSRRFYLLMGTFGGFVAWTVSMLFEFPFRMPATLFNGWLFAAIVICLSYNKKTENSVRSFSLVPKQSYLIIFTACSIMIIGIFIGKSVFMGDFYHTQGNLALMKGKLDQAKYAFTEGNKQTPWEENNIVQLIRIHLLEKNHIKAKLLADKILLKQPYLFTARLYRAKAHSALGNRQAAKDDINFVLRFAPYLPDVKI